MLLGIKVLFLLAICSCCYAFSCNIGRPACIGSCQLQNCATGYCDEDGICRCSRCDIGPPWEVNFNVQIGGKRPKTLQTSKNMTVNENVGTFQLCGKGSGNYMNRTFVFAVTTAQETATKNVDYNPNVFPTFIFFTQNPIDTQCANITIYNDDQMETGEKFSIIISRPIIENNAFKITMSIGNTTVSGNSLTLDVNILDDNDTNSVGSATASMLLCIIAFMATIGMLL